ncbi:hypothetical protein Y1Q_0001592 [Alligator mississippiensis]|uniref:Uncharacterized protein n=1 Tax=Alligator mississippiensis TaxID=8496 RepID=A0A151MA23_ALLMI|nr:hypothetical protein Y1Q_0001592 [Alligator mississippiensis]
MTSPGPSWIWAQLTNCMGGFPPRISSLLSPLQQDGKKTQAQNQLNRKKRPDVQQTRKKRKPQHKLTSLPRLFIVFSKTFLPTSRDNPAFSTTRAGLTPTLFWDMANSSRRKG